MGEDFYAQALKFIESYGYYIFFAVIFLENAAFIGLFIPGESFLLGASFLASIGTLNIWAVGLIAVAGAVMGDNAGYWLGKLGGRPLVLRIAQRFRYGGERFKRVEDFYSRHGAKTIFLGRWTQYLRILFAPLAGVCGVRYRTFLLYDISACVAWAAANCSLGYFLGENRELLRRVVYSLGWSFFGVLVALVLAFVIVYKLRKGAVKK